MTQLANMDIRSSLNIAIGLIISTNAISCNKNQFSEVKKQTKPDPIVSEAPAEAISSNKYDANVAKSTPALKTVYDSSQVVKTQMVDSAINFGTDTKGLRADPDQFIWVATRTLNSMKQELGGSNIYRLKVLDDKLIETKKWSIDSPVADLLSKRVFHIQGGSLVVGQTGGRLLFLDGSLPEGNLSLNSKNHYDLSSSGKGTRVCPVSFKRNGQRFIGAAYGDGFFIEFKQSGSPPYNPDFTKPSIKKLHDQPWAYSCYIDQSRMIYYSAYYQNQRGYQALDLVSMKLVDPMTVAPNAKFKSEVLNLTGLNPDPENPLGSYAMSGDRFGNLFNADPRTYTMAYEASTHTVWESAMGDKRSLRIYPAKCLYEDRSCKGMAVYEFGKVTLKDKDGREVMLEPIGPLSALRDGGMVGMGRNNTESPGAGVYILRLKDPSNLKRGITGTKIFDLPNEDPYQYTDFTGATLYLDESASIYEFSKSETWSMEKTIKKMSVSWKSLRPDMVNWSHIQVEIRCYANPNNKGEFTPLKVTADMSQQQFFSSNSCNGKLAHFAELKLRQLNNRNDLYNLAEITLTAFQ